MGTRNGTGRRLRVRPVAALLTALLAALGVAVLGGGGAEAYRLEGPSWAYKPRPMGESWQICTAGMPAGAVAVIKRAAAVWDYRGFRFTFTGNGCSSGGRSPRFNGVNQIDAGPLGGRALAVTYTLARGPDFTECDLRINDRIPFYVGTGRVPAGEFDLFSTVLHEFGHCLGLGHTTVKGAVMYPSLADGVARRRLTADDVRGRDAIYGR